MSDQEDDYRFDTLAVRAGQTRTAEGEHSEPVFTTSSYVFASAAEAAARFSGERPPTLIPPRTEINIAKPASEASAWL